MEWVFFNCGWCGTTYRTGEQERLAFCPTCGFDLEVVPEPDGGNWVTDVWIPEGEEPGSPPRVLGPPRPQSVKSPGLERDLAQVVLRGHPALVAPFPEGGLRDQAAVVHLADLEALAGSVDLKVTRDRTEGGIVHLRLEALAAVGSGPGLAAALPALIVSVRRRYREVLGNPMSPGELRLVAMCLWTADCTRNLPGLLRQSVLDG